MLIFRADGNSLIGAGHIMRCLSIADACPPAGRPCLFVTADAGFSGVITARGHDNHILHTDYSKMASELPQMEQLLRLHRPQALVVDSYYVTESYLNTLQGLCRQLGCALACMDDVLSFAYPCGLLINYNIYGPDSADAYRSLYRSAGRPLPQLLLGTAYTPLRRQFQNLREREVKRQAADILISTGGADAAHMGQRLAEHIARNRERFGRFHFHFVIGAVNEDRHAIEKAAEGAEHITLHFNVQSMAELMSSCDLAVSAAGSTLYELCAAQTPAVTYILADNQIPGAEGFARHGVLKCAGDIRKLGEELPGRLLEEAVKLAGRYDERVQTARKQREIVDGRWAQRIVQALFSEKGCI